MKNYLHTNLSAMKKILGIVTIATFMVACNQTPKVDVQSANTTLPDTTGLAAFQAWRAQSELQNMNAMMGQNATTPTNTKIIERHYYNNAPRSSARSTSRSSGTRSRSYGSGSGTRSGGGSTASTQKRGWSKAAKGAVIGGVAGGAAGAIINKRNRVAGGVIGAVVGAGGGYVIGRGMDKRDGRY